MNIQNLTEKQQTILFLCMIEECIKYAKENNKSFEEVLNQDVFPNEADTEFAEYICNSIKSLNDKGYINGTVELEYELEIDMDTFDENSTDAIDFAMCTFEDISISLKGKAYLGVENFKEVGEGFIEKAKPVIKCIATTALQTAVESAMIVGLRAAGFPI